jgi:hypothetical protein
MIPKLPAKRAIARRWIDIPTCAYTIFLYSHIIVKLEKAATAGKQYGGKK